MTQAMTISQLEKASKSDGSFSDLSSLYYSGVVEVPFAEFRNRVLNHDDEIYKDIYEGKVFILKDAFPKEEVHKLRKVIHQFGQTTPPSFHKILGNCPNFHNINEENTRYNVLMRVHSYHFFSWNDYPVDMNQYVFKALEVYETLCEQDPAKIIYNTCEDDIVTRIQVHHYPLGGGHTQLHRDPTELVKVAMIMMMTKVGVDYESGGLYFLDMFGDKFYPEPSLDVGDIVVFYPRLLHGVEAVDAGKTSEWDSENGRWTLLFNNRPIA